MISKSTAFGMVLVLAVIGLGFVTILDLDSADASDSSEEVYIVQFVVDGVIVQTCTSDNVIVPPNPSKEGFKFTAWTVDGVMANPANYWYTEDVIFVAHFYEYTYGVVFIAGGEVIGEPLIVKHGTLITKPKLPTGFSSWDFDFSTPITCDTVIEAIKDPNYKPKDPMPEVSENKPPMIYVVSGVVIIFALMVIAGYYIKNH